MASIAIFTSRQGKKRYRVHCLINGTTRRKDYRTLEEACHQLYLTEAHKLKMCTPVEFLSLRDFTVQKCCIFIWAISGQKSETANWQKERFVSVHLTSPRSVRGCVPRGWEKSAPC